MQKEKLFKRISEKEWYQKFKTFYFMKNISRYKKLIPTIIAILALFSYAYIIRNELKVADNSGNIKFVASNNKDSLSNGYKENIRKNININGQVIKQSDIIRTDWTEYGAEIKIPIYVADGANQSSSTLEIENKEGVKNLSFEYSTYDVGGYLEVYIDNVFYTKINTYAKELTYKKISFDFPQHYAMTSQNAIWWGQLILFAIAIIIFFFKNVFNFQPAKK